MKESKWPEFPKNPLLKDILEPLYELAFSCLKGEDYSYNGYEVHYEISWSNSLLFNIKQIIKLSFYLGKNFGLRESYSKPAYIKARELISEGITPERYQQWYVEFRMIKPKGMRKTYSEEEREEIRKILREQNENP